MEEQDTVQVPWRELLDMLRRQWRTILAVVAGGLVTVILLTWYQLPIYRASAKIMVTSTRTRITVSPDANQRPTVDRITEYDLNSEIALLRSKELLREVLDPYRDRLREEPSGFAHQALSMLRLPLQLPGKLYRKTHNLAPPDPFEAWVEKTAERLSVQTAKRSNLIDVEYEAADPDWAAQFVNTLISHHIERHVRLNQQAGAQRFFEAQRQLLSNKLGQAEGALQTFYERERVDSVSERQTVLRARLADLEAALADADAGLAENKARAGFLASTLRLSPDRASEDTLPVDNQVGQLIKTRIVELELQRSQLRSQFAPTSIKIHDIDQQIVEARRLLAVEGSAATSFAGISDPTSQTLQTELVQTKAEMAATAARIEALRSQQVTSLAQLKHLETIASEDQRLEREVTMAKQALLTYVQKAEEARFSNALDESGILNLRIVERATVPKTPQPSKRAMTLALGAFMSLCAGLGLAFVRDRLDPTVKSAAEAERVSALPILADIPT